MLRNFGTQDGELYKPDSMEMGGNKSSDSGDSKTPGGMNFPGGDGGFNFDPNNMPNMGGDGGFNFDPGSMPNMGDGSGFNPGNMPNMGGDSSSEKGSASDKGSSSGKGNTTDKGSSTGRGNSSDKSGFSGKGRPSGSGQSGENTEGGQSNRPDAGSFNMSDFGGKGGFSMGGGGANLNYTGDDLDNYSTIWEGEITATGNSDHKRVVEALKNISEGTDLEKYLDVDNVLKYMAVHTFSVNMDSLSGSMAHNYYLYEYNGQLNIFPWDYNLSLGGMSMGSSGDATDMVNDAIDTPFSGTKFFDKLLENEEYLAKYHEYLRQLVEEYVYGGRFEEVYQRIRSQIDSLVETDPTAFYSYEDYVKAAEILYQVINLRAQSIDGQLNGTIPSTDTAQNGNKTTFVDASGIDAKAMGSFNMGGFSGDNAVKQGRRTRTTNQSGEEGGNVFEGLDFGDFDFSKFAGFGGDSEGRGSFSGSRPGQQAGSAAADNIIIFGGCFALMLLLLVTLRVIRRKRRI
ncbi:MAG: CotH kinase family protein [Lachnospiraceae bacterium]|nr:CotH kinase family protein [Lachnospiraceae bacterium]